MVEFGPGSQHRLHIEWLPGSVVPQGRSKLVDIEVPLYLHLITPQDRLHAREHIVNHLLRIASLGLDIGPGMFGVQSQDAACRIVLLMTRGADEGDEFVVLAKLRVFVIQYIFQAPFDVVQEHYRPSVLGILQIVICETIFGELTDNFSGLVQGEANTEVEETSRRLRIRKEVPHVRSRPSFTIIHLESIYNGRGQLGEGYWLELLAILVQYPQSHFLGGGVRRIIVEEYTVVCRILFRNVFHDAARTLCCFLEWANG
ncbi:hypothetical protein C8Q73DRAFT_676046 [Cubamyces lactineus]|nr:hypothetical protein C8Q73DRAFT_676046 [Cubamyces lactineus]